MRFLQNLRNKPNTVKTQIAFWTATLFAGGIAFVWVTTLPARFADDALLAEETVVTPNETESSSFANMFSGVKDQMGALMESFQREEESVPTEDTSFNVNFETEDFEKREEFFPDDIEATSTTSTSSEETSSADSSSQKRVIQIATTSRQNSE